MTAHYLPIGIDPIVYCQNAKVEANKTLIKVQFVTFVMILAACLTVIPLAIELALIFTIINMNFGADLPDDPTPIKVYILSFATISALIAFHVLMLKDGEHPLAQLLRKISRIMVFFYFVGMFLLFSTTDMSNLMDGNLGSLFSGADEFTESSGETLNGFIAFIKPYLGLVSSLALGGLVFVNLAVVDALFSFIKNHLEKVIEQKENAKSILQKISEFTDLTNDLVKLENERTALENVTDDTHILTASAHCENAIKPTLRALKKIHFLKTNEAANDEAILETHGSHLPDPLPSARELQKFIRDIEGLIKKLPHIIRDNS